MMYYKNQTHVKKVGYTSEFPFGIYWWTLKNLKNQNFWKREKIYIYIYTGDIIILHMFSKNHNQVQSLRYGVTQFFLSFRAIFCPLPPPPPPPSSNTPQNQNFEKKKKVSGDVIILNLCNKKHNQMIYAYSDMVCARHKSPICPCRGFFWKIN